MSESPTCQVAMVHVNGQGIRTTDQRPGADIVVDVSGRLVNIIVPIPGQLGVIRLALTAEQLGSLIDELVEASELVTA